MKKLSLILISLFFLSNSTFASTYTYSSDPKMFVSELVNDAINKLSDNNLSKEEKATFVENVAIENIDINALGLYALGELRKSTDKNSLENYQQAFKKYFLKSLTSRLTDYSSNKFEITDSEKKSSNYTIVKSKIISSDNQPEIKIDWRVYTKNPDKPLIRDLIVEGLSLARTQKEEFSSILNSNNNDINILIAKLEEFING
jgi:phospholipid transport system substrate-binding protein